MNDNRALWNHLAANHGVISLHGALGLGARRHELDRLVELGALALGARSTFVASAHPRTLRHRVQLGIVAASLGGEHGELPVAASRDTATALWGIDPREREPGVIRVVAPYSRAPSPDLPWLRVHRSRTLTRDHLTCEQGIWVTTAARTTVDSAINRSADDLAEITARALQRRLLSLDELSEHLEVAGRIRGSVRLREAIGRIAPDVAVVESVAEAAAAQAFADAGLDLAAQVPVEVGGHHFRLDFAEPRSRLAVEVDGHWWHSTPAQKARDDRRQNLLAAQGWRVLRFGAGTVMRTPAVVVEGVRDALATRWSA